MPRPPRGPKPTTPTDPDAPAVLHLRAPRWLVDALDARAAAEQAKDPLGRYVSRQEIALKALASAALGWGANPPAAIEMEAGGVDTSEPPRAPVIVAVDPKRRAAG